jgi:hypothetical protein
MDMKAFAKHRKRLIAEGRIAEPKTTKGSVKRTTLQCLKMTSEERALYRKQLATKPDDYVPPTLDTVPAKWLDNRTVEKLQDPRKKTRKGKMTDAGFTIQRYTDKPGKTSRSRTRRSSKG